MPIAQLLMLLLGAGGLLQGGSSLAGQFMIPRGKQRELDFAEKEATEGRKAQAMQAALLLSEDVKERADRRRDKEDAASILAANNMSAETRAGALETLQGLLMAQGNSEAGFDSAIDRGRRENYMSQMQNRQASESPLRLLGLS